MAQEQAAPMVWNADDHRVKEIMAYLTYANMSLTEWRLEEMYSYLHSVKRLSFPKLGDDDNWDDIMEDFDELEKIRDELKEQSTPDPMESLRNFHYQGEKIYMKLNKSLKDHGLFLREGLDPSKAALR